MPKADFEGIEIINSELIKKFKEDKKGILDVRVKTREGKQIDVEIQLLAINHMPERTLLYWSKMYASQIKAGESYEKLLKCVTINIVDFECLPLKKLHTCFHLAEDQTGYQLTDLLEIHFLEIPKLMDKSIVQNADDPVVQWLEFIDGKSKGVMDMLAEKNQDIKKAYDLLQIISKDEKARMLYEAEQKAISDEVTRIQSATQKGRAEGQAEVVKQTRIEIAKKALNEGVDIALIARLTGLTKSEIEKLDLETEEAVNQNLV